MSKAKRVDLSGTPLWDDAKGAVGRVLLQYGLVPAAIEKISTEMANIILGEVEDHYTPTVEAKLAEQDPLKHIWPCGLFYTGNWRRDTKDPSRMIASVRCTCRNL